jgi:hypothetical protein
MEGEMIDPLQIQTNDGTLIPMPSGDPSQTTCYRCNAPLRPWPDGIAEFTRDRYGNPTAVRVCDPCGGWTGEVHEPSPYADPNAGNMPPGAGTEGA